eukprot:9121451-Alexandrium_andersonii.AAC.1
MVVRSLIASTALSAIVCPVGRRKPRNSAKAALRSTKDISLRSSRARKDLQMSSKRLSWSVGSKG